MAATDRTCSNRAKRKILYMGNRNEGQTWGSDSHSKTLVEWIWSLGYWQLSFDYRNSNFLLAEATGSRHWDLAALTFQHQPTAPCRAKWNWRNQAHLFRGTERAKPQPPTPAMCPWGHESKNRYSKLIRTSDFGPYFVRKGHKRKIIYFLFFFDEHNNNFQVIQSGVDVTQSIGRGFTWFWVRYL